MHQWLSTDGGDSCLVCGVEVDNPFLTDTDTDAPISTRALHWSSSNDTCLPSCPGLIDTVEGESTTHHFYVSDQRTGEITCHRCTLTIGPDTPFADITWLCPVE